MIFCEFFLIMSFEGGHEVCLPMGQNNHVWLIFLHSFLFYDPLMILLVEMKKEEMEAK